MGLLYKEEKWPGQVSQGAPLWPIYDCTGCGRCTEYCVYEMPVTQRLFDARQKWKWSVAEEAAAALTEAEDPVGDLAYELGDKKVALGRLQGWNSNFVDEPKSLQFVLDQGRSASLTLDSLLQAENLSEFALQKLKGKTWLFHESVWFSRHLKRWEEIPVWIDKARKAGIQLRRPFAHGMDCIDCGGEGAYSRLFPDQAAKMAAEFWERDAHRADGILCVSSRCAAHLRKSFGSKITIVAFSELLGG
jgi:ferredoxin